MLGGECQEQGPPVPSPRAVLGPSPASTAPPWGTAGAWMSRSSGDRKWGKNGGLAFNTSTAEVLFHPGSSMPCMAWALCFLCQQQQAGHTAAIPHSLPTQLSGQARCPRSALEIVSCWGGRGKRRPRTCSGSVLPPLLRLRRAGGLGKQGAVCWTASVPLPPLIALKTSC